MGIVKSQAKPMAEYLVEGHSQPWEHRGKQFTSSFVGWLPQEKDLNLKIAFSGVFDKT